MIISANQLQNISRTIFNLMNGVYELDVFKSPYNDLITCELSKNSNKVYKEIGSLIKLFNKLDGTDKDKYENIDRLHDAIDDILEEFTISAISMGYLSAKKIIDINFSPSPYHVYFRKQLFDPHGLVCTSYERLCRVINKIEQQAKNLGDTDKVKQILERMWQYTELEYSTFVDKGFSHGLALGNGEYPLWYNPEFENNFNAMPSCIHNLTKKTVNEFYNCAGELFDLRDNYVSSKITLEFMKCQDEMIKSFPEFGEPINKICFFHSLYETTEINDAFYRGFEFGLRMAVDVFYREK